MIMQWRASGLAGLRGIVRSQLAVSMVEHLETLARNSFLGGSWKSYGTNWDKTNFAGIAAGDLYNAVVTDDVFLGMQSRATNGAVDASGAGEGTIIALTSPGVIHTIQKDDTTNGWISRHQYANPAALLQYEVGTYRGVRYLSNPAMTLYNCGEIVVQSAVKEALYRGNGASRNVDANRVTGQAALEQGNRYIQLDADDLSGIEVNDIITIHAVRTADFGVTNGVDFRAGTNTQRRVVSVDNATKRITVDRPILKDAYTTDLGGSVYGYVTKGRTIHATAFLTGPNAVVAGVAQPPQTHVPPVLDDVQAYFRFSWDAYLKYQIWNDHNVEVAFNSGPYRIKGAKRS